MEDTIIISKDTDFIKQIPLLPGCYMFKNENGDIQYIGKAKILRRRIYQYFKEKLPIKIQRMVYISSHISYITTDNDVEALILENNLIKKYKPKYNSLLKDDKRYTWVKITNDYYPKIERVREKLKDKATYFGPFPSGILVIRLLSNLRKIFPYRTCNLNIDINKKYNKSRLCIYYDIGLCTGPCDFLISRQEYLKNIDNIKKFFKGEKKNIINDYIDQMDKFVKEEMFEEAAKIRDKIEQIQYVSQNIKVDFGEDETIFQINKVQSGIKAAKLLFKKIGNVKYTNGRIECYDISNIQGKYPVSSMVVFKGGQISKSDYRKFKIKIKNTPDDPAMMYETIKRRLTNSSDDKSFSEKPDLIIVDGGKTQLGSAIQAMKEANISIPVFGLAKKQEEIILPNKKHSLKLKYNDPSLLLIRKIRDEAHRFANTFHRKLRSKGMISI